MITLRQILEKIKDLASRILELEKREVIYRDITAPAKSVAKNSYAYQNISIEQLEGYTALCVMVKSISGSSSGYQQITCNTSGDIAYYNPTSSNVTLTVSLRVLYLKN